MSCTSRKLEFFTLSFLSSLLLFVMVPHAFSMDDLEILRLSSREQTAVIRTAAGGVHLVRVGEAIGADGRVIQIDSHGLVIREIQEGQAVTVIIRLEDGRQTIRTVKNIADKQPVLYQTVRSGRAERP